MIVHHYFGTSDDYDERNDERYDIYICASFVCLPCYDESYDESF